MTDSDLVRELYEDDEIACKYANPQLVAENIDNPSFLGWEVSLPAIPAKGDSISLRNICGALVKQWRDKLANRDAAITYFLNMVEQDPHLGNYCHEPFGEQREDTVIVKRILWGVPVEDLSKEEYSKGWNRTEGLFDGTMVVTQRFFVPDSSTVILAVKHIL